VLDLHGFGPQLLGGSAITLGITAGSVATGLAIGLVGAIARLSGPRWLQKVAGAYTTVVRGVPDLLIIFVVYYGGTVAATKLFGHYVEVDAVQAGIGSLAFIFGAYATEIFRGAVLAVPKGQWDAALALGLGRLGFYLVILPQAWRLALPPLGNQTVVLLKQTSLVSVIGLEELMRRASMAAGTTREPFAFYLAATVIYLVFTGTLTVLLAWAQGRADRGTLRH
jgi:His/Glu/Gln/Arg/opine family amino acid ABC transporter permease subunit